MNITLQTICFNTAENRTAIQLSRHVDFNLTTVQYIRDGEFVTGKQGTGSSPAEAFQIGLAEINDKICGMITSVSIEVTCEMLWPDEVKELMIESSFSGLSLQTC